MQNKAEYANDDITVYIRTLVEDHKEVTVQAMLIQ